MKRFTFYLLSFTIYLGSNHFVFSQTQSNLVTPKGSSVVAYIVPEMSDSDRAYWDSYWSAPNRTQIITSNGRSSSRTFNCHGYAWSMAEGGATRWIGYYVTTDEDVYMTDGSYVQVCSETHPGKISWGSGDHSAVTTGTTGRWRSKWNMYPLMEHNWNDTPYGTTNLKYYASTAITGITNSALCSGTRNFSVQNIPGGSYTWTTSSTLTITSGAGTNQITVARNGSSAGVGWVQVQISTPCSTVPATRRSSNFIVGTTVSNPNYWLFDASSSMWQLSYNAQPGATSTYAVVSGSATLSPHINDCYVTTPGGAVISLTSTTSCGSAVHYFYLPANGGMFKVFPNPAKDMLTLQVKNGGIMEEYPSQVIFYSQINQNRVKTVDINQKSIKNGNKIEVDVRDLPRGLYYLHVVSKKGTEKIQILLE